MINTPERRIHVRAVAEVREHFVARGLWSGDKKKDACPFFHCKNEGKKSKRGASDDYSMGLSAGVSDLVFVVPALALPKVCPGAALEIKAPGKSTTPRQKQWLAFWAAAGFATAVTKGHEATAIQLAAWGYISPAQRDRWIAWAREHDPEAF